MQTPRGDFTNLKRRCNHFLNVFPDATPWLKWHLQPDRAVILFNACKGSSAQITSTTHLFKDTNAQENIGRQFQYLHFKNKINVQEALIHAYKFCNNFNFERKHVLSGGKLKHGIFGEKERSKRKKHMDKYKKRIYYNDGRPPDTSDELLNNKPKKQNRKKHASTKIR